MDNVEKNKLIKPFAESVLFSDYEDTLTDFAEISLDEITKMVFESAPDILCDLPIVKSVVAISKLGWSIKNALVLRNQLTFIQTLKRGSPDYNAVKKRQEALKSGENWIYKEIETTVVYLERYTDTQKAKYQAKLYSDVLNGTISYSLYEELLIILDNLFPQDIRYFLDITNYSLSYNIEFLETKDLSKISWGYCYERCRRLEYLGLLKGLITTALGTSSIDKYTIDPSGYYLYHIFKENSDHARVTITINKPIEPFVTIRNLSFSIELLNQ